MATAPVRLSCLPPHAHAAVLGASGGIGAALAAALEQSPSIEKVHRYSRSEGEPRLDVTDEESVKACAAHLARQGGDIRIVFDATGFLHDDAFRPEKSWSELDPDHMARAFAVNAIGPALILKHFLPLLPEGRAVFASLSAKVGGIGDNRLGGWYSYRASKAALNQIIKTASIELKRRRKEAVCVALHPGTVDTPLSQPFSKSGLKVRSPETCAHDLLEVIEELEPDESGGFFDYQGDELPW